MSASLMVLAAGCSGPPATSASAPIGVRAVSTLQVTIPGADRFSPFITVVRHGAEVTFHNGDTDAHSVTSIPGDPVSFDKVLQPGESWTLTLNVQGSYRYYCAIHARYDPATGQVEALPNADHPNEPMEGVVVVGG